MTTGTAQSKVQPNGRIVLEGIPLPADQQVRLTWVTTKDASVAERLARIEKNRDALRGSILRDDADPSEPACAPSEWDANRG